MITTIHTTGFNVLAHGGFSFRSANEVAHRITRKEAKTLREQPGYQRGARMSVMFTESGATRLYVDIGAGYWMDASLRDLGTIEPKKPSTPKWVDVLNAAEPGTAR